MSKLPNVPPHVIGAVLSRRQVAALRAALDGRIIAVSFGAGVDKSRGRTGGGIIAGDPSMHFTTKRKMAMNEKLPQLRTEEMRCAEAEVDGHALVTAQGYSLPVDLENALMLFDIFAPQLEQPIHSRVVLGRDGLIKAHIGLVGYDPDADSGTENPILDLVQRVAGALLFRYCPLMKTGGEGAE